MTIRAGSSTEASIQAPEKQASATPEGARKFIENAETKLFDLWIRASRAQWVQQTFITHDTEILSAQADQVVKATTVDLGVQSKQYEHLKLPEDVARKIYLLKHAVDIPAPRDPAEQAELSQIVASLESDYGQGKWCPDGAQGKCLTLNDMENIMASSRDPKELERIWVGWHSIAPPMRQKYSRMVVLANKGARELGFANVGEMWRAGYDMPPDAFGADLDRLWQEVRPLYISLHTYVRSQLAKKYGSAVVREDAPIPADLLGNMWAQDWSNIYPLVAPPDADPGYDLTEILKAKNIGPVGMGTMASVSLCRSVFRRCRQRSGIARCSPSRAIAKWSAMRAPGTLTALTTCASKCASSRRPSIFP
jgi:peptidyl-dipeptidase A